MSLGKLFGTLASRQIKKIAKGSISGVKWAEDIIQLANMGGGDMFGSLRSYSSTYKRWIWRAVAPDFVRKGYSTAKMLDYMRRVGLGIKTQDAYNITKYTRASISAQNKLSTLGILDIPTDEMIVKSTTEMPTMYRYVVSFNAYDDKGNFLYKKYFTFYFNQRASLKMVDKEARNILKMKGSDLPDIVYQIHRLEQIFVNPRL